jgi:hypothetical protein
LLNVKSVVVAACFFSICHDIFLINLFKKKKVVKMKFKITNFRCRDKFKLLQFFNLRYSQLLIVQFIINNHRNYIFQR